ncbi:MAG: hypothetical protein QXT74_01345 [Candidatus Nezhaarchaeales archaeon]
MGRLSHVALELAYHAPFTALGTAIGMALVWALALHAYVGAVGEGAFHALHAVHILLSAMVTAAVYRRHGADYVKALAVGVAGSVPICSVSDVAIPFLGGRLLGLEGLELHICLLMHPQIPLASALLGSVVGAWLSTKIEDPDLVPHGGHVMVSVMASLLYLASFTPSFEAVMAAHLPQIFAIVFIAVLAPCCTSDIVIPIAALPSHLGARRLDGHGWLRRVRRRVG